MSPQPPDFQDRYGDPLFAEPVPPQCGWLSPEGWFAPCRPWQHTERAYDIATALRIEVDDPVEGASGTLFVKGWVKIARKSRSDLAQFGGRFHFEAPTLAFRTRQERSSRLTAAQASVEAAWMELDAIELTPEAP